MTNQFRITIIPLSESRRFHSPSVRALPATPSKAASRLIDRKRFETFHTSCYRSIMLRNPWIAKRSYASIRKELRSDGIEKLIIRREMKEEEKTQIDILTELNLERGRSRN